MGKILERNKLLSRLYYDPARPTAFSTLKKLKEEVGKRKTPADIKAWLEKQEAYTLHRKVRKRFPRNPYSVNNVHDVWECDLVDVQGLSKYNDGVKYLLTVIDVFSKFLHIIPLLAKTGKAVTIAFQNIFNDPKYSKPIRRRPVWVRTDRGKEFLNKSFQDMLKREGIQFQICKNPDVKCSVIERAHRTIRDKLYKFFTYKNSYRYVDVLQKFVRGYNETVHSTTGMAPKHVSDSDVLEIWKRMNKKHDNVPIAQPKFRIGQHVRISKEKMKFAKGGEQNYTTEVFRIIKVIRRTPRPVFELEDLNRKLIDGQFFNEELTPVRITKRTTFKIDKILSTRVRRGIREYLVRWKGYGPDFDSWINSANVKNI
jgi:transposase InsO family protein